MTINLDARIIPGAEAAGIRLGTNVTQLLLAVPTQSVTKLRNGVKYDFGAVCVWSEDDAITQIGVRSGYRGSLESGIRIGSTIGDVERYVGSGVEQDDADCLVAHGSPGWCFETEGWKIPQTVAANRDARIVAIFVFEI